MPFFVGILIGLSLHSSNDWGGVFALSICAALFRIPLARRRLSELREVKDSASEPWLRAMITTGVMSAEEIAKMKRIPPVLLVVIILFKAYLTSVVVAAAIVGIRHALW